MKKESYLFKSMYSKYFQFHILQDIPHTFAKKQIAWIIHKNLFSKIFWVFRNVTSERRIASLTENVSFVLSWFLCSVWIQISTSHYKTDWFLFLSWLTKIITITFPQALVVIKLGKSINKCRFSVFNQANLVWEILLLPCFVKLWFSYVSCISINKYAKVCYRYIPQWKLNNFGDSSLRYHKVKKTFWEVLPHFSWPTDIPCVWEYIGKIA